MRLYGRHGWGSALIEAQLAWYGVPYEFVEAGELFHDSSARAALKKVNPLAQVPTLVLSEKEVLTESAAMTLTLAERFGRSDLVPLPGSIERDAFLRWLIFVVANIYPTFTYADDPSRFVRVESAQRGFRDATDRYRESLWEVVDSVIVGPWFLGERFSALDIYLAVMARWRPKLSWFALHASKIHRIAIATADQPELRDVFHRNFADS